MKTRVLSGTPATCHQEPLARAIGNQNHSQLFLFERKTARLTCTNSESNFIARPSGEFRCLGQRFELFKLTLNLLTRHSASQKECASVIGVSFRIRAITLKAKSFKRIDSAASEGCRIVADMQRALFDRQHPRVQTPVKGGAS